MLQGKVILITGAGRGIGRETAIRLAQAGASIVLLSRNADELAQTAAVVETHGGQSLVLVADVTEDGCAQRVIDQVRVKFGRLDILVNMPVWLGRLGRLPIRTWKRGGDAWK